MNKEYKYRKVPYTYHVWTTFDGRLATGYHCEDEKLLDGLNTVSFGAITITEMQDKIDNYIDNRKENLKWQAQYDKAEAEYYEKYGTVGEF
jgi:flagellar capping protein FliD